MMKKPVINNGEVFNFFDKEKDPGLWADAESYIPKDTITIFGNGWQYVIKELDGNSMNFDVLGDYLAENSQLYNSDLQITIELKVWMKMELI